MITDIAMVLPHTRVMEALPLPSPDSNSLVFEGQSESRLIGEEHPGPLLPCPWQIMSGPGQTSIKCAWVRRADQTSSKCAWVRRAASVPGSDEQARPAASGPGSDEQQVCLGQTCSKCAWVRGGRNAGHLEQMLLLLQGQLHPKPLRGWFCLPSPAFQSHT